MSRDLMGRRGASIARRLGSSDTKIARRCFVVSISPLETADVLVRAGRV